MRAGQAPGFLTVQGLSLRVAVEGRGQPLLLISGLGASLDVWEPLREILPGFQTIAFDIPGVGESPFPSRPLTIPRLARLTAGVVETLGYDRVDVMGVSWGGGLAQELAHRAPDRVRRLVLAATSFGLGALPGRPRALIKLANPFRYHTPGHLERIAPTIYGGGIEDHPELLERFAETLRKRPPSTRGFLWQLVAAAGWTSLPWLRRIPHPTLVVAGDRDPIAPLVNARLMTRMIPNARLHVVRGGGHLFLLTHASEVASVIGDFLRASGPASGEAPGA
ncbi:MAG: alpha/beta fold hydrolase [Actinobacteria bacterium]|nr:MAG: alpha/beta fold hydrolase [Actinomycetota bacterium]